MSLSVTGSDAGYRGPDPDRLLAGYRAGRAQQTLFDARGGPSCGGDIRTGGVRQHRLRRTDRGRRRRPRRLARTRRPHRRAWPRRPAPAARGVRSLVDDNGIAYIEIDRTARPVTDHRDMAAPGPGIWTVSRCCCRHSDWATLEAGVVQRSRLLDAVLSDLYGEQRSLTSGAAAGVVVRSPRLSPGGPRHRNPRPSSTVHARL